MVKLKPENRSISEMRLLLLALGALVAGSPSVCVTKCVRAATANIAASVDDEATKPDATTPAVAISLEDMPKPVKLGFKGPLPSHLIPKQQDVFMQVGGPAAHPVRRLRISGLLCLLTWLRD